MDAKDRWLVGSRERLLHALDDRGSALAKIEIALLEAMPTVWPTTEEQNKAMSKAGWPVNLVKKMAAQLRERKTNGR
jgi:hypothetical protein